MLRGVRIGELDRRITFQQQQVHTNQFNEDKLSGWEDVAVDVAASVKQAQGDENYDADKLTYTETTLFTIRYRTGLTNEMRIVYQGNNYDIRSIVEPYGYRKTLLEIKAVITE